MGILTEGRPLTWEQIQPHIEQYKKFGAREFARLYNTHKDRKDGLKWGDEMEYCIVKFDKENERVRAALRAKEILEITMLEEQANEQLGFDHLYLWRCELNEFMIESSPGGAFESLIDKICSLEENMKIRRTSIRKLLGQNESIISATFPALGCGDYFVAPTTMVDTNTTVADTSLHECVMTDHPRFKSLESNIRKRRGRKIAANLPVYKDKNTETAFTNCYKSSRTPDALPDHIYSDSLALAMGCCGFQITVQGSSLDEARLLHDQLSLFAPLIMALTAATPILGGHLTAQDTRWQSLAMGVDDRTISETLAGLEPRWGTPKLYVAEDAGNYNDVDCEIDPESYSTLIEHGVDHCMAMHVARLFVRDPIVFYNHLIDEGGDESFEHFDQINATNYNFVRMKGPPTMHSPDMGWRVELRTMEIQLTEFENAAYTCFVMLLTRVIVSRQFDFRVPISKLTENMERAQRRDAVNAEKFHFSAKPFGADSEETSTQLSLNEIVNGCHSFAGLLSLIEAYLDDCHVSYESRMIIDRYLEFISKRASGEIWTQAKWARNFVSQHSEYKQDSRVPDTALYELWRKMDGIANGDLHCVNLLGAKQSAEDDTLSELDFAASFGASFSKIDFMPPKSRVRTFSESLDMENWEAIARGEMMQRA